MRKTDLRAFAEFIADEAMKYGRDLTKPEIETYFENFPRTTLEDFKAAWIQHKRDPKHGAYFPKITDLQRVLRTTGEDAAATDWRCAATVGDERCGFPGGIFVEASKVGYCCPHYQIWNTATYNEETSMQIIEESRSYVQPKTNMEKMERGQVQRAIEGERWRNSHPNVYAGLTATKRLAADALRTQLPARTEPTEWESIPRPPDDSEFSPGVEERTQ